MSLVRIDDHGMHVDDVLAVARGGARVELTERALEICAQYRVTLDELAGSRRTFPIPRARAALWSSLRDEGLSYPRISEIFGVHHTTVLVAIRRHVARLVPRTGP